MVTKSKELTLKRYDAADAFLEETESYLIEHEVQNVFLWIAAEKAKKESSSVHFYCSAVWDGQNRFIFALFCLDRSMLYGSCLRDDFTSDALSAVDLAMTDYINTASYRQLQCVHAFEPAFGRMKTNLTALATNLKLITVDQTWSYDIKQVQWPPRALKITQNKQRTELKQAIDTDVPLLAEWLRGFWNDNMEHIGVSTSLPSAEEFVLESLISRFIYILYVDGIPVSMCWKRRPSRNGCSISFVYTPNTERGKGYASACVAMCTELFLKEYSFVTLFVVRQQDPNKNLYTSIGYQLVGKSARLRTCTE
jgi:hypothetical protein